MKKSFLIFLLLSLSFNLIAKSAQEDKKSSIQEVNLYTHRHYDSDKELLKIFENKTGIKVNVVSADADQLIERLKNEGERSPADLLITVDAGRLHIAKNMDLLQPVESAQILESIPDYLKDRDNYWFALTKRARVFAYDKTRVNPESFSTYEDLTNEKWKGKIVVRSSSNLYNQSLLASIIGNSSIEYGKEWAKGVLDNMAREPKGNDRDQMKAVAAGIGDFAIVNTYYLGNLLTSTDESEVKVGESMGIFFPNQNDRGTHINISGIGLTKYAKNTENAIKLINFLLSVEAQEIFASGNHEYPVNPNARKSELVASWGDFKEDTLSLSVLGELNNEAVKAFDEIGWK